MEVHRARQHPAECGDEAPLFRRQHHFPLGTRLRGPALFDFQALDAGGSVRKGEHGTKVSYVSKMEKPTTTATNRTTQYSTLRNVTGCPKSISPAKRRPSTSTNATLKRKSSLQSRARISVKVTARLTLLRAAISFLCRVLRALKKRALR
jgi:hypothetical protein